jgi:hypothetical protein
MIGAKVEQISFNVVLHSNKLFKARLDFCKIYKNNLSECKRV